MNNKKNLHQENINNLTTLWRLAGEFCGDFKTHGTINMSYIPHSDWPSRIWLANPENSNPDQIISLLISKPSLKFSVWKNNNQDWSQAFPTKHSLELRSKQTGMYLSKPWQIERETSIELNRVQNSSEAIIWSELFKKAFEYEIPPAIVESTSTFAKYYIAYIEKQPIGTVMLFSDHHRNVSIHNLGVPPEFRRRGFAKEITLSALKILISEKPENIFLQASDAAVNLYRNLGFKDHFEMQTYAFPNPKS